MQVIRYNRKKYTLSWTHLKHMYRGVYIRDDDVIFVMFAALQNLIENDMKEVIQLLSRKAVYPNRRWRHRRWYRIIYITYLYVYHFDTVTFVLITDAPTPAYIKDECLVKN